MTNSRDEQFMKTRRLLSVILTLFIWLPGWAIAGRPLKPPLDIPFAVQRKGETVTTELKIVDHRNYLFLLQLWSKKHGHGDRNRVAGLAGGMVWGPDGKMVPSPGMPIPVRLTITEISSSGERVLYDQSTRYERLLGWGDNVFTKVVATVELRPGLYRVSAKSLQNIPALAETSVTFGIGFYPNSTPID